MRRAAITLHDPYVIPQGGRDREMERKDQLHTVIRTKWIYKTTGIIIKTPCKISVILPVSPYCLHSLYFCFHSIQYVNKYKNTARLPWKYWATTKFKYKGVFFARLVPDVKLQSIFSICNIKWQINGWHCLNYQYKWWTAIFEKYYK